MNTMAIVAIVLVGLLVVAFFITYVLNSKTPVPKGCEHLLNEEECSACNRVDCNFHKSKEETKEE